jgi:hypothetical protein
VAVTDADTVLAVLLLVATGAAVLLTRRAVRYWRHERAGQPYELPVDRRGTALRAAAAGATALVAATLAVTLLDRSPAPPHSHRAVAAASHPTRTPPTSSPARTPVPAPPPPPSRTPEPAPPPPVVRTLGHPAGGTLQALADGTQVWLPPFYDSRRAAGIAYPVVLARVPAAGEPELYEGFAQQLRRRVADAFILVTPHDCGRDVGTVLAQVARAYRTLTTRTAQAALGIGPEAPCAVREALAHPSRYSAAVGISGTYPPLALAPTAGPPPSLLLVIAPGETAPRRSARALRDTLRPRGTDVRVLDGIAGRRHLFAVVAGYFTEKLDGPARVARTSVRPELSPSATPPLHESRP